MSVSCEAYIGYTVTLKKGLNHEDFDFFGKFTEEYPEYGDYNGESHKDKVTLIVDGMNGCYARLMYVDKHIENCWIEDETEFRLRCENIPDDVYEELNKAYTLMYNKRLDDCLIEYSLWFHFT